MNFISRLFENLERSIWGKGIVNRGQVDASSNGTVGQRSAACQKSLRGEKKVWGKNCFDRCTRMQIRAPIKRRLADRWPTVRSRNIIHESTTDTSRLWLGKEERKKSDRFYTVFRSADRSPSLSSRAFHLSSSRPPTSPPICFSSSPNRGSPPAPLFFIPRACISIMVKNFLPSRSPTRALAIPLESEPQPSAANRGRENPPLVQLNPR